MPEKISQGIIIPEGYPLASDIWHPTSEKVLLLESSTSHTEGLHAQIRFLNALGVEVHLWVRRQAPFELAADEHVAAMHYIESEGLWDRLKTGLALRRYLTLHGIGHMVINSVHGLFARDISLLLLGHPVQVTGILHYAQKLGQTVTQNLIARKVKRYFVLAPYMLEWAKAPKDVKLETFYYVNMPAEMAGPPVLPKPGEEIRIVVPGAFEPGRRDYPALLDLARKGQIPTNITLVLLGNIEGTEHGRAILHQLESEGLGDRFVLFKGFVPDTVFNEEMRNCAAVLSLLHPHLSHWEVFSRYSISGSYSLAFAYKKPLICLQEPFSRYEVFRDIGLFYEDGRLGEKLRALAEHPEQIAQTQAHYAHLPELAFEEQARRYGRFLFQN